jgi:hypothetical protein
MGTLERTIPANEIVQTGTGWVDTLPVYPGQGGLNLIVRYDLPYENGVELSHPLHYNTSRVTLILPEVGVELEGGGWNFQGAQQMAADSSFLAYDRTDLPAGSDLTLSLRGEPSLTAAGGNALAGRNQTSELLIGGGILLMAVAGGVYMLRTWQSQSEQLDYAQEAGEDDGTLQLIQAIANLDDAFEDGQIDEETYHADRERLKSALEEVWE